MLWTKLYFIDNNSGAQSGHVGGNRLINFIDERESAKVKRVYHSLRVDQ